MVLRAAIESPRVPGMPGRRRGSSQMGFMDKFKDAAAQAQQAAQGGDATGGQLEVRDRAMKLNQSGVDTPATVTGLRETGNTDIGGGKEIEFTVEVQPAGGSPYTTTFNQYMIESVMQQVSEGSGITVRVDPDDPNSMLFWGLRS
jgi:uncharacterized protein DUF3592